ncbi:putative c2h2 transcription protein [Botrytis cinerea BcDW1]|uniref:Putative c2h2 transcription protein n=1 Tax=Botryotinia fuckeliana (strain BcDW1) TaxID=1290391 RepID=M7U0N7_BOTF1|nr:putative c2h2 transcription protein [Botrytis cinerea BcDW1]
MQRYSQQDHSAYEMPNFNQTWQSIPGEELFTGGIETNTITNTVFDAELMTNWQIPNPDQFHLSGELFMESAQFPLHAELTTHHCPVPMANHSMQAPLNQGFLSATRSTHQFLQRPFNTGSPSNQTIYPALDQSPCYPAWEQRGVGDVGGDSCNIMTSRLAESESLPSSSANATVTPTPPLITPHPITGRYPCSYPNCAQDFNRSSDRLRHISSVHQRGQTIQGKNLCPIVGCRRSYGRGLCRPDKVNDHLRKVHGLVRVAPNGASASAGSSAHGTGDGSNVDAGAALARNGNS